MSKSVTFGKHDEELITLIQKFQHKNEIASFTEAVRQLCRLALEIEKIREGQKHE